MTDPHPDTETVLAHNPDVSFPSREVVPKIRETSWPDFKNRFEDDQHEYAIEMLVEKPGQSQDEQMDDEATENSIKGGNVPSSTASRSTEGATEKFSGPRRIRINSPYILRTLGDIDKTLDASLPNVMLSPFKFLVYHEPEIRNFVRRLEDIQDTPRDRPSIDDASGPRESGRTLSEAHSHADVQITLSHMRCLIEFMDMHVMPTVIHWRTNVSGKIHFRDLWYIFRPGEDVFMPIQERYQRLSLDPTTVLPDRAYGLYQLMWRVTGSAGGRQDLSTTSHRGVHRNTHAVKINCYHIDFDGKYFTPIVHTFSIEPYKGARDVTSLQLFPVWFLKQAEKIQGQVRAKGKLVFDAIVKSRTHFYYVGPTMNRHPCDCPFSVSNTNLHQEHVESEVIVDFSTAIQMNPSWAPNLSSWKEPPTQSSEVCDNFRTRYWSDRGEAKLIRAELDHVYDDNAIDRKSAMAFKRNESLFNPFPSSWLGNEKSIREQDIVLLTACVFAFVLRTRTFAPLWLQGLESIRPQSEGLRNLQLQNNSLKNTIHALVRTHFLQNNSHEKSGSEPDAIRGKGKGLIILLHGAPGVGKTFTAESIAAANGRPLFSITCGDLGLTPIDVEKSLNEIFRFAQMWNCVLLLDECDIFLSQRTKTDLKRNSLVSVFLRVLEFYTGVLFLTTNRVGSLDSAVKSRITWSTYYPPLDLSQTREIWKVNLDLLAKRKPNVHFDKNDILAFAKTQFMTTIEDGNNWNGRQIQNAFKVALSLADWDAYSSDEQRGMDTNITRQQEDRQVDLTSSHFQIVGSAVEIFEKYLQETTGRSEGQRAYDAQERADTFVDIDLPRNPGANYDGAIQDQLSTSRKNSRSNRVQQKRRSPSGDNHERDRPGVNPVSRSSHRRRSGNAPGSQPPRSRNSFGHSDAHDAGLQPQVPWTNNSGRQYSPHRPLSSTAAAMVSNQRQSLSPSVNTPAKERKLSDGRNHLYDREGLGSKSFPQSDGFGSGSDFGDDYCVDGEAPEHDSDW